MFKAVGCYGMVAPHCMPCKILIDFPKDQQGQNLIEYSLLLAFVCLASGPLLRCSSTSVPAALLICLLFVLPGLEKPGSWLALRWWHWRERRRRGRARKRQNFPSPFST